MTRARLALTAFFVGITAAAAACATPRRTPAHEPEPLPLEPAPRCESTEEEPPPDPSPFADGTLTLDEALALAARRNPEIVLARAEIGIADARVAIANVWPHDPSIRFEGSTDVFFGDEGEGDRSVGVAQTFETGGGRSRRTEAAKASRRATSEDAAAAEWRARAAVSEAFYSLLAADEDVRLAARRRDIAAGLAEIAEIRLRAADVSIIDANLVRAAGHRARALFATAERERAAAALRLARLLGLPARTDIAPSGELPSLARAEAAASANVEDLERVALASRREIAAAIADREAALARAKAANASRWPDVTVDLFYARETSVFELGSESGTDRDDILGLGVEIPLPFFSRATGERQEAIAEATLASARLAVLVEDVRAEVRDAAIRASTARDLVALYEERLNALAEENRNLIGEAFRVGEVGAIEVLRAREEEATIEEGYLAARRDVALALVAVDRAIGIPLDAATPREERP